MTTITPDNGKSTVYSRKAVITRKRRAEASKALREQVAQWQAAGLFKSRRLAPQAESK